MLVTLRKTRMTIKISFYEQFVNDSTTSNWKYWNITSVNRNSHITETDMSWTYFNCLYWEQSIDGCCFRTFCKNSISNRIMNFLAINKKDVGLFLTFSKWKTEPITYVIPASQLWWHFWLVSIQKYLQFLQ